MKKIEVCPSTLALGYDTYSPLAIKRLFNGKTTSPIVDFEIAEISQKRDGDHAMNHTKH